MFALHAHRDRETTNPLDVAQWRFFVCAAAKLDRLGEQQSMGLASVLAIAAECQHDGLARMVVEANGNRPGWRGP